MSCSLLKLPPELLEHTIVFCVLGECPTLAASSISALAQTCRFFANLIYRTPDHHLWREIFLSTFDDPRPVLVALHEATPTGPPLHSEILSNETFPFDFQAEFQRRMQAAIYIRRQTQDLYVTDHEQDVAHRFNDVLSLDKPWSPGPILRTMRALVSVLQTAAVSPHITPFMEDNLPSFPHLVLLQSASSIPPTLVSRNAQWMHKVLEYGYPIALSRMLFLRFGPRFRQALSTRALASNKSDDGESTTSVATTAAIGTSIPDSNEPSVNSWAQWEKTKECHMFYKLVTMTSFIPNPPGVIISLPQEEELYSPVSSQEPSILDSLLSTPSSDAYVGPATRPPTKAIATGSDKIIPSAAKQISEFRAKARAIVYDVAYLRRERCWGPFLPYNFSDPHPSSDSGGAAAADEPNHTLASDRPVRAAVAASLAFSGSGLNASSDAWSSSHTVFDEDVDDDDYQPDGQSDSSRSDAEDGVLPMFVHFDVMNEGTNATFIFPDRPDRVHPDWVFLAAARLLIEQNIREMLTVSEEDESDEEDDEELAKIVEALHSLELVRMGGVPRFWQDSWINPQVKKETDHNDDVIFPSGSRNTPSQSNKLKGKEKAADNDFEGWDWAGVEGAWRRCVCWMDYRDLVLHSLNSFNRRVEETIRIFPMVIRITRYSPPPPCPPDGNPEDLIWRLPIIHYEGDGLGSDVDPSSRRKIRGSVRMIGGDAVRWSMNTSTVSDPEEDEWMSENVQIGGIGSAIGLVGLWTSAEHARADPLGPCWAWKVA